MSLRLAALNLILRLTQKRQLARVRNLDALRSGFERTAARVFRTPEGAHFQDDRLRAGDRAIPAVWASAGRPDRRRVILYLHGGAFILGSPATHRRLAAALAGRAGARAVAPDYRLAPEHPFPAALDDVADAYAALLESGYDPASIAVAGDSAGGGLAFSLILEARARGLPPPACVAAFSPWVDLRLTANSLRRNARRDPLLPVRRIREVRAYYLAGHDPVDPRASPILGDWTGSPPVLIQASRSEILADDATGMAERLRADGVDVRLEMWRGTPHVWQLFHGRLREADAALDRAGAFIARHLAASGEPTE